MRIGTQYILAAFKNCQGSLTILLLGKAGKMIKCTGLNLNLGISPVRIL